MSTSERPSRRTFAHLSTALCLGLAAACATPDDTAAPTTGDGIAEPGLEEQLRELDEKGKEEFEFNRVLVRLDQAIESYVKALSNRGDPRADSQIEKVGRLVHDLVVDEGAEGYQRGKPIWERKPGANFAKLKALAESGDPAQTGRRGVALAALGFSEHPEVMQILANGAMSDDSFVVDKAVLGLALLRAPDTPPGILAAIVEDDEHPRDGRVQAAWALYQLQTRVADPSPIVAIWHRFLEQREQLPDAVLVQAVRGLGLTGDDSHADEVSPLLLHPMPRVRMATAIALGRMNAQDHWQDLLTLLEPSETVQNVRLHARKALMALAGNKDYGYDVRAWQKQFERGR